jgi:hypothetical protein
MTVLFDTLKMAETLQAGGFSDQQARAMTQALGEAATIANVATRGDVLDLGIGMKHDFEAFKTEMRTDFLAFKAEMRTDFSAFKTEMRTGFSAFQTEMKHDLGSLEQRMTIRMGGMMVALAGVLSAVLHYLR